MNYVNENSINKPFRYDFFTIWGNGLPYKDEILNILRNEEYIEIIRIELRKISNMKKFVFDLYASDTVPIEHLRAKLKYLFQVKPEILIVFVKNYNSQKIPAGQGAFRKVQCQYINQIKIKIRNKYNPRDPESNFHIKPLDKGVSHEHVIHASDYEEQVDYFLKMLGYKTGIKYLHGCNDRLPFRQPYYLEIPTTYIYRTINIDKLRASILDDSIEDNLKKISDTPHYHSINEGTNEYDKYIEKYKYNLLTPDYAWNKFLKLNRLRIDQIINFDRIIVKKESNYYRILDGVHRAAVTLNHKLKNIRCVEICD